MAEISEDVTANAIFLLSLTFVKIKLIKHVFSIPPGTSIKNISPFDENALIFSFVPY